MAAKTELRNLKLDRTLWRQTLDKARSANPVTMTKAQFAVLQKAFHPDPEHDTATPERNRQLNAAAAVFNALKFRELTGHDQDCHYQKILAQASIVATQTVARLSVVPRQGPCPDAPL
jgi:hypothetical protein